MKKNNFDQKDKIQNDILDEIKSKSNKFHFYKYFVEYEISHKDGQFYNIYETAEDRSESIA